MFWKKTKEDFQYFFKESEGADYDKYLFPYTVYAKCKGRREIGEIYNKGFLQSRLADDIFYLARSVRIDLSKFELSSENKRILNKTEFLELQTFTSNEFEYSYEIGKMAIDFYTKRFGDKKISAQKWKWIFTSGVFDEIQIYKDGTNDKIIGYCPSIQSPEMLHYAYPFYDLEYLKKNLGISMMLNVILDSQGQGRRYVYLGTCYTESSLYKSQFKGFEWFTGEGWSDDIDSLKKIVRKL